MLSYDYSPQTSKAMQASEIKRRSYWPALARTSDRLILTHPHRGSLKHRSDLAAYVRRELPEFRWDSQHSRWWAPLNDELLSKALDAFTQAREIQLRLSDGVRALLENILQQ